MAKLSARKAASIDHYYKRTGFERHKTFFSTLFTLLLLIGVFVSYSAVQQQQSVKTRADVGGDPPTITNVTCNEGKLKFDVDYRNINRFENETFDARVGAGYSETALKEHCSDGGEDAFTQGRCGQKTGISNPVVQPFEIQITKPDPDTQKVIIIAKAHKNSFGGGNDTPWDRLTFFCMPAEKAPEILPTSKCENDKVQLDIKWNHFFGEVGGIGPRTAYEKKSGFDQATYEKLGEGRVALSISGSTAASMQEACSAVGLVDGGFAVNQTIACNVPPITVSGDGRVSHYSFGFAGLQKSGNDVRVAVRADQSPKGDFRNFPPYQQKTAYATATFPCNQITVQVKAAEGSEGSGSVSGLGGRIDCKVTNGKITGENNKCGPVAIQHGADVRLTATAADNSRFNKWVCEGCDIEKNVASKKNAQNNIAATVNFAKKDGPPPPNDKCKDVKCTAPKTCNPDTGKCENGGNPKPCRNEGQTCGSSANGANCCQDKGLSCSGPTNNPQGSLKTCKKSDEPPSDEKVCRDFNTQTQCQSAKDSDGKDKNCKWAGNAGKCVAFCGKITAQSQCQGDCIFKNQKCVAKAGGDDGTAVCRDHKTEVLCHQKECTWGGSTTHCVAFCGKVTEKAKCQGDCAWNDQQDKCLKAQTSCQTGGESCGSGKTCCSGLSCSNGRCAKTGGGTGLRLKLAVKFAGIVKPEDSNRELRTHELNVKVKLANPALEPQVKTVKFQTDEESLLSTGHYAWVGDVTFEDIPAHNNYYLLVKGPNQIQKKICNPEPTENQPGRFSCGDGHLTTDPRTQALDLTGIVLLPGDVIGPEGKQDGVVDSLDLAFVRNLITKENPSAEELNGADLNLDGEIDTQDFSLIISALSIKSDER